MTKSTQFSFRVSPEDLARWREQARLEGRSVASLIVAAMNAGTADLPQCTIGASTEAGRWPERSEIEIVD